MNNGLNYGLLSYILTLSLKLNRPQLAIVYSYICHHLLIPEYTHNNTPERDNRIERKGYFPLAVGKA